jgi:hypothetical protein
MHGWLYRRAVAVKEFGERHNIRLFIVFGLLVRDSIVFPRKTKTL